MHIFKRLLEFYINSSIHVAFAALALVQLTYILFGIANDNTTNLFAFFGTIVGYNFVKYNALLKNTTRHSNLQTKGIAVLTFLSLIVAAYFFLHLQNVSKIVGIVVLAITLLYTLPFFPNQKNARNWAGFKIYIVALCWVAVTHCLPVVNTEMPFSTYVLLVAVQRFILIFVLVLIFEIIDLQFDDPHLKTVPQQIGVLRTKQIGVLLMVVFVLLELLSPNFKIAFFVIKACLAFTTIMFLLFANENRSRYYASFWAESIPIFWWLLLLPLS